MKSTATTPTTDKPVVTPKLKLVDNSTISKQRSTPKPRNLTIKRKKFVSNKIKGQTNATAYVNAGYKASTRHVADVESSKLLNKPEIQQAIDNALAMHELTPEMAVAELKKIVVQNKELGAKRLAIKDTLELHGWRRDERPTVSLTFNNAFFSNSKPIDKQPTA